MTTETIGGCCPNCQYKKMLMRFGSNGWFQYDACPKCGFGYGANDRDEPIEHKEFWENTLLGITLHQFGLPSDTTLYELYIHLEKTYEDEELDRSLKTVFNYPEEHIHKFRDLKINTKDITAKIIPTTHEIGTDDEEPF